MRAQLSQLPGWRLLQCQVPDGARFNEMVFDGDCFCSPGSVAKGSRLELGVWGLDPCSLCVSRLDVWGRLSSSVVVSEQICRCNSVPMEKVAKGVMYGCFKGDVAPFRVAGGYS